MTDTITTDLDPTPSRQRPSTFSSEMDTFLGKLPDWTDEANALATGANTNATNAAASALAASTSETNAANSETAALGAANYKGSWSSLTGSLAIPASVSYSDAIWVLLEDVADVTAETPGVSTKWELLGDPEASQAEMEAGTESENRRMSPLNVQQAIDQNIPSGVILLWSGSTASIPTGWAICDGTNGTPNLQNKFVVGAGDTYVVDATGGSTSHTHTDTLAVDNHTLTEAELASHTHELGGESANNGTSSSYASRSGTGSVTTTAGSDTAHDHSLSGSVTTTTTLPPYYALAYIMKL